MYLKRMEMVGFKSFADRTRLDLEPGITAVIGPNGCGKSNVVDAIRWCLGEMSAKSLRSKILLDVVFNGSANRAPSNMAEVSLTFDNSQNRLPIDYSEVTVTRRLFRSGESEYFMNKTQCRLKDIRELFLDTGIGEEGYSIMEQGRVEYVLSARPEERRELFEEAAGVSKYKARREEALRKMERTQLDLDRLADVIAMTKEQMDKIEAAVRKARLYQKAQEDLKVMEISHALWETSQLDQQITALKQEIQRMEEDLQSKTTLINQREAELAELRLAETQLGERMVAQNREISDVDGAIGLAEQKQADARRWEESIRQRDTVLDEELAKGRVRLEELEKACAEFQQALDAEAKTAEEAGLALKKEEESYAVLAERQKTTAGEMKGLQDALWKNNQDATQLHNEIGAKRSLETRLDTELKTLQKDRAKSEEKLQAAQTALTQYDQDIQARDAELRRLEETVAQARAALAQTEADLTALAKSSEEVQSKLFQCKAQLEAQEKWAADDVFSQGAHAVLSAGLSGLHGPLGKLIAVEPADEPALRQVMGPHLNDLVADSLHEAQAALQHVTDHRQGRVRVWVLDRLPQGDVSAGLSGGGQRSLLEMVRADAKFQPVLKFLLSRWLAAGTTLYGEGVIEGGAEFAPVRGEDPLLRASLEAESPRLANELELALAKRTALEDQKRLHMDEWEKAHQATEAARVQKNFFAQEHEKTRIQTGLFQDEIRLIDGESERLQNERRQAEETARALAEKLRELTLEEARLREQWTLLQERTQKEQIELSDAGALLGAVRERAQSQQERLRWREKQLHAARSDQDALAAGLESKQQERSTSQQRIEEQQKIQEECRQQIETSMAKRKELEQALEGIHAEKQTLYDRLTASQNELTTLRDSSEEIRTQLQDKKLQANHSEFKRESFETQLKDKYGLTLLEAQERHPLPTQAVVLTDLERLRRRVESLGAVNLAAPEEHAELEQRYNFLLSQQQDLLKAKEDLLQTIQKINATTRSSFRDCFDKVRENFKAIYGQLFQGGEADLRLTDESDILNTGIEVFAQPPGKKLQNIALLSGGEKALTAVALLFAFFMVRPAPFCILDEVDAPLDEANVTRFITLIKAFTHQSQFLMITHNKRTMETADVLYGVTMETLGVTKLLSAKLRKDGRLAETLSPEAVIAGDSRQEPETKPAE
ncbi:MAG TPA: AAA family ATPase [Elusimicrobiota bacterium]|nr:AAA family ATPase [Elusimicrobiota bacterium]